MIKYLLLTISFILFFSSFASAEQYSFKSQVAIKEPLLKVRFNQPEVRFSRQLRMAVAAALQTKAETKFSIVVDRMPGSEVNEANYVAETFQDLISKQGVAKENISILISPPSNRAFNEVNVYVE